MSEFWSSSKEVSTAVLGMLEKSFENPEIREKGEALNVLLAFNYEDPDVTVWIDARGGKLFYSSGAPPEEPDVQMTLSSDNAHRVWSNKLNVMVSIAKKKISIKGSATKILKLAPLLRIFSGNYNEKLKEMGKESIILD